MLNAIMMMMMKNGHGDSREASANTLPVSAWVWGAKQHPIKP